MTDCTSAMALSMSRTAHIGADDDAALGIVAADLCGAGQEAHLGHFGERDEGAGGRAEGQLEHVFDAAAVEGIEAYDEIEAAFVFKNSAGGGAGEGGADGLVDIADVEAVAGDLAVIELDDDLREALYLLGFDVFHAFDGGEEALDAVAGAGEGVEVFAEDFDGNIGAHAGHHFVEAHFDGLRELEGHAGNLVDFCLDEFYQFGLGSGAFPERFVAEQDDVVGGFDGHGVGGNFGGTDFGNDLLDFIGEVVEDDFLRQAVAFQSLRQRGAGPQETVHHDVAFI